MCVLLHVYCMWTVRLSGYCPAEKKIMFVASCTLLKVAWRAGYRHSGTLAEFCLLVSHAFAGAVGFGLLLWEFGSCNEQAVLRNMSFKH